MSRDALVVGINTYQNLPSLQAAAQDAESLARCLESFGECRTVRLPESISQQKPVISQRGIVTTAMLEEALIKLFKPPGKTIPQTAIFYYSGHGLQRQAGIQEGFLATSDANPAAGHYGLSLNWLRRLLQESPVRQRVILLDCCNSGEFFNMLEADPGARAGTDRLFMAAAREYEAAYESLGGSHSVFTQALLSGLNPYKVKGGIVNGHSLTDTVNRALKGELQQPLFESSGGEIVLTRLGGASSPAREAAPPLLERLQKLRYGFCPFPGAAAFDVSHKDFFFGRSEIVQALCQRVQSDRLCVLVGSTGAGKTSLLRAGLLPSLAQPDQPPTEVRYLAMGAAPLPSLAEVFVAPGAVGIERAEQLSRAEAFLRQGPAGFCQLVQGLVSRQGAETRLVLVLDQFEALLATPSAEEGDQAEEGDRRLILDCLTAAVQHGHLSFHLVLGLQSHCLGQLADFPSFYSLVADRCLALPAMTYNQLKTTIVGPLEKMGLGCEANLIYTLLLDVVSAPADLALLQRVLKELWTRRETTAQADVAPCLTLAAYAGLGGLRQLLNQQAEDTYRSLSSHEQDIAQRIFLSLCELGDGTTLSRRQVCLEELVTPTRSRAATLATLHRLAAAHLVVLQRQFTAGELQAVPAWTEEAPEQRAGAVTAGLQVVPAPSCGSGVMVEVAHEALIRNWPLLQQWVKGQGDLVRQQRTIETYAQDWQQQQRPHHPDYFLTKTRLGEAKQFQQDHPEQLSVVANDYLMACDRHSRRSRRQRYLVRLLIPLSMVTGMLTAYGHSHLAQPGEAGLLQAETTTPGDRLPSFSPVQPQSLVAPGAGSAPTALAPAPELGAAQGQPIKTMVIAAVPATPPLRPAALPLEQGLAQAVQGLEPMAAAVAPVPSNSGAPLPTPGQSLPPLANQVVNLEASWVSPHDPGTVIQIWCTYNPGAERLCFTSTAARPALP
jgi:hypothetical protein